MTAMNRTRMMRLISNGVPSNQMAGGKKSAREGAWKPPLPSSSAASGRIVARLNRAVSCGRWRRVPRQCGHEHGVGPSWMGGSLTYEPAWSGPGEGLPEGVWEAVGPAAGSK